MSSSLLTGSSTQGISAFTALATRGVATWQEDYRLQHLDKFHAVSGMSQHDTLLQLSAAVVTNQSNVQFCLWNSSGESTDNAWEINVHVGKSIVVKNIQNIMGAHVPAACRASSKRMYDLLRP